MRVQQLFLIISALFFLGGCELLNEEKSAEQPPVAAVFVANQGNFSDANGSITVYDPATGRVIQDAIPQLGSIVQSLTLTAEKGYIMANTADRVDEFNISTLQRTGQITGVTSPRYMLVDRDRGYVTNLYKANFAGGMVTRIDLSGRRVDRTVDVGNNPEGITIAAGKIYVANHGFGSGNTLSVIDPETFQVVDTVTVDCDGPRFVLTDAEEEVWVFCTGKNIYDENWNLVGQTPGRILVLDGATAGVRKVFDLTGQLGTTGPGQDAYYAPEVQRMVAVTGNEILLFDTQANAQIGRLTLTAEEGASIGAVALDGVDSRLYVGWVTGFTTAGWVGVYTLDGTEVTRFTAGIAPTCIAFQR